MAVRVWREWFAVSLVLALGACSGKSGQNDADVDTGGTGSTSAKGGSPGKKPGQSQGDGDGPGSPTGGTVMVGFAGEASQGGGGGRAPDNAAGAPEVGGAAETSEEASIVVVVPGEHMVHESFGTVQVQVILTAPPRAAVTIGLVSADPAHADVYPPSLTFTPANWSKAQSAVVVGVRDTVADGGNSVTIQTLPAVSTDAQYAGMDPADLDVYVIDETDVGIVIGPTTGLVTSEAGGTAVFNLVLASQPTATVTIPLSSTDLTEGSVVASVVFEPDEWSVPHPVTVTGVDDELLDGGQPYLIETGLSVSNDPHYADLDIADVQLINVDNE